MFENIVRRFTNRWQVLLLVALLLLAISPEPLHRAWVGSIKRASVALQYDRIPTALEEVEAALVAEPALASLHLLASDLAFHLGDQARSEKHLLEVQPGLLNDESNFCRLARLEDGASTAQTPDASFLRWIEACPSGYQQAKARWLDAFRTDPGADQLAFFEALHRTRPDDAQIHSVYAQLLSVYDPGRAPDHLRRLSNASGGLNELERDLLRVITSTAAQGSQAYLHAQVGQVFARYQRWPIARASFQAALQVEPDYVDALAYLGLAREQTGQDGSAEILSALAAAPEDPRPYAFLALHYLKRGETELASDALDSAARRDPENPAIAAQLGSVYAELGDFSAATQAYLTATDLAPDDARFWLLLANFSLYYDLDLSGLARPAARNAISVAPQSADGYEVLGTIQLTLEEYALAERSFRTALAIKPDSPGAQYNYGLLMEIQGHPEIAQAAFDAAAIMDAGGHYGQMAERMMD